MSTMTDIQTGENETKVEDRPLNRDIEEITTPTTPKPASWQAPGNPVSEALPSESVAKNPFTSGSLPGGQLPLPTTPFAPPDHTPDVDSLHRETSQRSAQSSAVDDMDIDGSEDDLDGSDNDTENGEAGRSSKKKKGQRFFCTDFPPCNLSFTRSEHLARHIRKHTGERPFQCHCNRRFSRLDNLRQHAQTVHVNEEIPGDSLAATGTRFQRQIRTDRVRPATGRPRSGTVGSTGSHGRGHSRNLSTSSIGSTNSSYSTTPEPRRRPPPLIMATDGSARPKIGLDPPSTPPAQFRGFAANSPGGLSTLTSTTHSGVPGSPGYGSTMDSPISSTSRSGGFFASRTPNRRLSVPSSTNPFLAPNGSTYPQSYHAPSNQNYSNQSSVYASPTSSTFSYSRADPNVVHGEDWRRRTWHPSTYPAAGFNYSRPATSSLTYSQTPDAPQPAFAEHATIAAGQAPRLPGIESFDQMQHRPTTPPRRQPSPMQVDPTPRAAVFATPNPPFRGYPNASDHRRGHHSLDMSLNTNLTRLDLHSNPSRDSASWSQQTINELQNVASHSMTSTNYGSTNQPAALANMHQVPRKPLPAAFQAQPSTPQRSKRHGWYNGPLTATRTSPEDSSSSDGVPTPGTSVAEIHPAIMHSNGYIEPQHHAIAGDGNPNTCIPAPSNMPTYTRHQDDPRPPTYYTGQRGGANDMGRLEALVAVATSEDKAATSAR